MDGWRGDDERNCDKNMKDKPTINQQKVVKKTIEKLGKGEIINKGKILQESGYSKATSINPEVVYDSDGVKGELEPIVSRMTKERDRLLTEAQTRVLTDVRYKEIMDSLDTLTKNIQLLSGGTTENINLIISKEVADKYETISSTIKDSK